MFSENINSLCGERCLALSVNDQRQQRRLYGGWLREAPPSRQLPALNGWERQVHLVRLRGEDFLV